MSRGTIQTMAPGISLDWIDAFQDGQLHGPQALAHVLAVRLMAYDAVCKHIDNFERSMAIAETDFREATERNNREVTKLAQSVKDLFAKPHPM